MLNNQRVRLYFRGFFVRTQIQTDFTAECRNMQNHNLCFFSIHDVKGFGQVMNGFHGFV